MQMDNANGSAYRERGICFIIKETPKGVATQTYPPTAQTLYP